MNETYIDIDKYNLFPNVFTLTFQFNERWYDISKKEWKEEIRKYTGFVNCNGPQIELTLLRFSIINHYDELCGYTDDGSEIVLYDITRTKSKDRNTFVVKSIKYNGVMYEKPTKTAPKEDEKPTITTSEENKKRAKGRIKDDVKSTLGCLVGLATLIVVVGGGLYLMNYIFTEFWDVIEQTLMILVKCFIWGLLLVLIGIMYHIADESSESKSETIIKTIIYTAIALLILYLAGKCAGNSDFDSGMIDGNRPDRW